MNRVVLLVEIFIQPLPVWIVVDNSAGQLPVGLRLNIELRIRVLREIVAALVPLPSLYLLVTHL
jgi:hypothetical protein